MSKYRRPAHSIVEEPGFFVKHWWHSLVRWAVENKDQVLTAAAAILVIFAAALLWRRHTRTMDIEGWAQFSTATSAQSLEVAIAGYSGTTAGPYLKLKLADAYLADGKVTDALDLYTEAVLAASGETKIRARFSLAAALAGAGRFEDARKTYKELAAGNGFWADEARATLDELPKVESAYRQLEQLKEQAGQAAEEEAGESAAETSVKAPEGQAPAEALAPIETAGPIEAPGSQTPAEEPQGAIEPARPPAPAAEDLAAPESGQ